MLLLTGKMVNCVCVVFPVSQTRLSHCQALELELELELTYDLYLHVCFAGGALDRTIF